MKFLAILLALIATTTYAEETGLVPNIEESAAPAPTESKPETKPEEKLDISDKVTVVTPAQMATYFPLFVQNAARIHPEMKLLSCTNGRQFQLPGANGNLTLGAQCSVEYAGKTVDVLACTDKTLSRFDYVMPGPDRTADLTNLMFQSCYGG